ncbi:MAG: hypothetical protein WAZ36_00675 [Sediminibacterium sp.]
MNLVYALFKDAAQDIDKLYPELNYGEDAGMPMVSGILVLRDDNHNNYDSYNITIRPTKEYPMRFPLVFETGGRLPVNVDWHVFESDGHCCIKTIPEEILICKNKITLNQFIEDHVSPYFAGQSFREENGFYLHERSHGIQGTIEFLKESLITDDLLKVYELLSFIIKQKEPGRTHQCFCGKKMKYRKCHRNAFRTLSLLDVGYLKYFQREIRNSDEYILPSLNLK